MAGEILRAERGLGGPRLFRAVSANATAARLSPRWESNPRPDAYKAPALTG